MVEAPVLAGSLDGDHIRGLLDHADQRRVPARVLADPAARALGEVEAHLAQAHLLPDLANGVGEPERRLFVSAEDVEGEPLRRALTDPGQAGELRDQSLNRTWMQGP